jgi:hypothetical protein
MQQSSFLTPQIQSQEKSFQDERRSGLGGSDIGGLYNLDFGCRRKLTYDKTGVPEDFQRIETPEMERGTVMEHVCKMVYEKRTGRKVSLQPLARHPMYPWMIVHVDGEVEAPTKPGPGYAEFKVVNRFAMKKFRKEGIRESYILQLQHGMAVKDYQWGSFGLLCLDPWQFEWFDVDKDFDLQSKLYEDEETAWRLIEQRKIDLSCDLPEQLPDLKDKRCMSCAWRRTCRGSEYAASLPERSTSEKGEIVTKPELEALVQECVELAELRDQAGELCEESRTKLKEAVGTAYGVIVPGYRALCPTSYPERVDQNALKALETKAKALLATEREDWDLNALEDRCTELLQVVIGLSKIRKAAKPERSLRIYPTGD